MVEIGTFLWLQKPWTHFATYKNILNHNIRLLNDIDIEI